MANNRLKKKIKAASHNYVMNIKDNILPIGTCSCGETLFMYLKSEWDNIPKYYCYNKTCESGDIRNPKDGDNFFFALPEIAKVIIDNYGPKSKELFQE
jgi:hypothetical protein